MPNQTTSGQILASPSPSSQILTTYDSLNTLMLNILYNKTMIQVNSQYEQLNRFINGYIKPNDRQACFSVAVSILIQVIAFLLMKHNVMILGWVLNTLNMVRLFILFHDMAHFSFFSSITMNKIVGKMIGIYVHFPFNNWRDGHNHHHKHFGNLDRIDLSQTILFTKKQYQNMKFPLKLLVRIFRQPIIFFTVTIQLIWFFAVGYNCIRNYGLFSSSVAQKIFSVILFFWIFDLLGIPTLPMYLSLHVSQTLGTILFHLQHAVNLPYREHKNKWDFARAALQGSTFLQIPKILKTFSNGIEYHHIHHLNTNVASYNIRKCHEDLENNNPQGSSWDKYNINRVDLSLAATSLLNVMYDEQNSRMIPFSYSHI